MNNELLKKDLELIYNTAKELSIHLFLDGGTLLGAIRENNLLPHDHDFDFGILRTEFPDEMKDNFINIFTNKELKFKGFEAPCFDINEKGIGRKHMIKFWSRYAHWNTDFWIFEKREKDYYHKGWGGYFYFPKECLDTLDERDFIGVKVLVPHNPELYLENLYGKNWKISLPGFKKPHSYQNWKRLLI